MELHPQLVEPAIERRRLRDLRVAPVGRKQQVNRARTLCKVLWRAAV